MEIQRKKTRKIKLGGLDIGGGSPVSVQSMTKSKINSTAAIRNEIKELIACGCEVLQMFR
jgi:(E)-4-hydroxy-3-methylbut-2-enyl-diphosphate synthase